MGGKLDGRELVALCFALCLVCCTAIEGST